MYLKLLLALLCVEMLACSGEPPSTRADAPLVDGALMPLHTDDDLSRDELPAARSDKPATDPKLVAEATELLHRGVYAYQLGEYDEAEQALKRSITIYPFLAPANLALGKIFLLRGAATRDEALIESARLMFDMAHNIDPSLREPVMLLELFKPHS